MALQTSYEESVVLVTALREGVRKPIGTAFIVAVATDVQTHRYFVTARHVVRDTDDVSVRIGRPDNGVRDLAVAKEEWKHHLSADVSVALCRDFMVQFIHPEISINNVIPEPENKTVMLGGDVYFIGLLRNVPMMAEQNVPMVRSGTIGRLNQHEIRMRHQGTIYTVTGHLIDCRAYQGMSGAPCFYQSLLVRAADNVQTGEPITLRTETYLLGLISAHFDDRLQDRASGADAVLSHTGVGVVTPARFIRELLLDDPELVADRTSRDEAV
jgi:hypothetical protein